MTNLKKIIIKIKDALIFTLKNHPFLNKNSKSSVAIYYNGFVPCPRQISSKGARLNFLYNITVIFFTVAIMLTLLLVSLIILPVRELFFLALIFIEGIQGEKNFTKTLKLIDIIKINRNLVKLSRTLVIGIMTLVLKMSRLLFNKRFPREDRILATLHTGIFIKHNIFFPFFLQIKEFCLAIKSYIVMHF